MFIAMVRDMKPGSKIEVTVDRKGTDKTITVTIGERPSSTSTTVQ
jgi:S1-C subfamily serine protease